MWVQGSPHSVHLILKYGLSASIATRVVVSRGCGLRGKRVKEGRSYEQDFSLRQVAAAADHGRAVYAGRRMRASQPYSSSFRFVSGAGKQGSRHPIADTVAHPSGEPRAV